MRLGGSNCPGVEAGCPLTTTIVSMHLTVAPRSNFRYSQTVLKPPLPIAGVAEGCSGAARFYCGYCPACRAREGKVATLYAGKLDPVLRVSTTFW